MHFGPTPGPSTSNTAAPYSSFPRRPANPTASPNFRAPPIPHLGYGNDHVQHEIVNFGPGTGRKQQIDQNIAMWVGNIPADASDDELFGFFAESNPINVFIRRHSRCAFINYRTFDEVDDAVMKYNRSYLRSCQIVCRKRRERSVPDQVDIISNPRHHHTPAPYTHFRHNTPPLQPGTENGVPISTPPAKYFVARCKDDNVFECILHQMKYVPSTRGAATLNEAIKSNSVCVFVIFFEAERRLIRGLFRVTSPIIEGIDSSPVGYHIYPIFINVVKHTQIPELHHPSNFDSIQDGQEVNLKLALSIHNAISYAEPTTVPQTAHHQFSNSGHPIIRPHIGTSRGFSPGNGQHPNHVCQEIISSPAWRSWDEALAQNSDYIVWDGHLLLQPRLTPEPTLTPISVSKSNIPLSPGRD